MAEVAGLVLGGIPLAIWALEKYAEPYEAFHNYRMSIETFRTNLILQNRQLQTTLSNIGLGIKPSNEELRVCFETKFSSISRELIFIINRMDDVTVGLMKNLDIEDKPDSISDKAKWEWRRVKHSFNSKKCNRVIEDLRRWNEDLRRSLEQSEVPAEDDSRKVEDLKRRFSIQRCSSIRQCFSSLHRALESGFCCTCSPPHQAAIDLDWAAYDSGMANQFKVAISYRTNSQPDLPSHSWRKLHVISDIPSSSTGLVSGLLTPSPASTQALSPISSASIRSKITRFKLRKSSQALSPPSTSAALSIELTTVSTSTSTAITSLCDAVCTDCNLPSPTGVLIDLDEDQGRQFSLDHDRTDSSRIIKAVPLKTLISSHGQSTEQHNPYLTLSAKQRYGIAASIAWSVLHLSGSPWLGDYWDEEQTSIFIERNQGRREMLSRHPCVSYVFNNSSPTASEALPANDFMHLIPNRTVFALGILLIELCLNKPFAETHQVGTSAASASLFEDYQAALIRLDEVYRLAGDSYGYAAERCVKFSFQGRDIYKDFDLSQFRKQFYDGVVAPVQATYLMLPDLCMLG